LSAVGVADVAQGVVALRERREQSWQSCSNSVTSRLDEVVTCWACTYRHATVTQIVFCKGQIWENNLVKSLVNSGTLTQDAEQDAPGAEFADDDERSSSLIIPSGDREQVLGTTGSIGIPGRPFDQRTPFLIGLSGTFGVAVAYLIVRGVIDIASVLVLIGLSLFIAIGLNPIVEWLIQRRVSRGLAVIVVAVAFLLIAAGLAAAAFSPVSHEVRNLVKDYPHFRSQAIAGRGWFGRLVHKLHLTGYLKRMTRLKLPIARGVLEVGKVILSAGAAVVVVIALTTYFLIALPRVREFFLGFIPRARRERVALLTDEAFTRVGGFMMGNLLTSIVSSVGTFLWLVAFGIPYPLLLALFVGVFDLIPMVGSTIAGIVVSLVALTRGFPIAIATAVFYIAYRLLEDYLLNPRVMKHTVRISPGLTIVATLMGAALLGIIGALFAIPIAATSHLLYEEVIVPRQNKL